MLVTSNSRRMDLIVVFIIYVLSVLSSVVGEVCDSSLQITYDHAIQCNEQLDISKMVDKPVVAYGDAKPDSLYTVVLKDMGLIMMGGYTFEEPILWLLVNNQGNSLKNGQIDGVEQHAYDSPDVTCNLYRFVVLEHLNGAIETSTEVKEILNLQSFIIVNNLQEVGTFDLSS